DDRREQYLRDMWADEPACSASRLPPAHPERWAAARCAARSSSSSSRRAASSAWTCKTSPPCPAGRESLGRLPQLNRRGELAQAPQRLALERPHFARRDVEELRRPLGRALVTPDPEAQLDHASLGGLQPRQQLLQGRDGETALYVLVGVACVGVGNRRG